MFSPRRFFTLIALPLLIAPVAYAAQSALVNSVNTAQIVAATQQKINTLAVPFVPNTGQWDRRAAIDCEVLLGHTRG